VVRLRAALALLLLVALLAACGGAKHHPAATTNTPCTPGLVLDRPGGHEIVCTPIRLGWVPHDWVITRLKGFLFGAEPRRPPRLMNMYVTALGTYRTVVGMKVSIVRQLPKLFPGQVDRVRFARTTLPAGPALLMTKPPAKQGAPAVTVYFVLHAGTAYELDFETSGSPTVAARGTMGRIAHSLRFAGSAVPRRYDVVYTLGARSFQDTGPDGSSILVRFRYLWFSGGRFRVDATVTNESPGLLTLQFGLLLVRYADASSPVVKSPAQQVRSARTYDPPPPKGGLAPGKSWHGSAVGTDTSTAGPVARAGIAFRTILPAAGPESNAVTADYVVRPFR
jgi:hypothetical protein